MRAIILAGGKGTRLEPYTHILPKPLMPVGKHNRAILDINLDKLAQEGFTRITLCCGHMAETIKSVCGSGSRWGIDIDYVVESEPLGTAGPLTLIDDLPDKFLVMNGDVLTSSRVSPLLDDLHYDIIGVMGVANRIGRVDYGVVEFDKDEVCGIAEKPVHNYVVSTGIYAFDKEVMYYIPEHEPFDMPELMKHLVCDGLTHHFLYDWHDLGRPEDFEKLKGEDL